MRKDDVVLILENARFIYSQEEIDLFVSLWAAGYSGGIIAKRLKVAKWELALLVIHCELEGLIGTREGGFKGTIKEQYKKMGRPKKEMMVIQ